MSLSWGREICGNLETAESREWLCTNGIGGFASGTVADLLTRRYHGLLVAALKPAFGRTLRVAKMDEIAEYDGLRCALSTNRPPSLSVENPLFSESLLLLPYAVRIGESEARRHPSKEQGMIAALP